MKRTILMLWVAVALASCSKSKMENTIAQGRILAYGSNQPVAGARVILQYCAGSGSVLGGGLSCFNLDTVTTAADGKYKFDFVGNSTYLYQFTVRAEGYAKPPYEYDINNLQQVNEKNVTLDPYSWIRLHVKNIRPFDSQDVIRLAGPWGGGSDIDLFYGTSIDTVTLRQVFGNRKVDLLKVVVKNSIQTIFRDTIYIAAHDTINYEILY